MRLCKTRDREEENRQTDSFAEFRQGQAPKIIPETLRAESSHIFPMVYAILKSTCHEAAMHATLVLGLLGASAVNAWLLVSYLHA